MQDGNKRKIEFSLLANKNVTIEIHENTAEGKLLASCKINTGNSEGMEKMEFDISQLKEKQSLCFVFKGVENNLLVMDSFSFK